MLLIENSISYIFTGFAEWTDKIKNTSAFYFVVTLHYCMTMLGIVRTPSVAITRVSFTFSYEKKINYILTYKMSYQLKY